MDLLNIQLKLKNLLYFIKFKEILDTKLEVLETYTF